MTSQPDSTRKAIEAHQQANRALLAKGPRLDRQVAVPKLKSKKPK